MKYMAVAFMAGMLLGAKAESRRTEAVGYIKEAREVHERWVEELSKAEPGEYDEIVEQIGPKEHHEKWVRRYDVVLEVLEQ